MLVESGRHPQVNIELICHLAMILYTIWYPRNQVIFKGMRLDVEETIKLARTWQGQYILPINNKKQPATLSHPCINFAK